MTKSRYLATLCAGLLAGCATTPPVPSSIRLVEVSSGNLGFSGLHVRERDQALALSGSVVRRNRMTAPIPGHVHIEAFSGGERVAWSDARWGRFSRQWHGRSAIFAKIPVDPARIDEIRVTHMETAHATERQPGNPT